MSELKLKNGSTVAIIGGGPAGTSCAIKLKKEAAKINLDLRIVIFEGKDFDFLYNQCVGVLSPPFLKIIRDGLNLEFPAELIKRKITGYNLHGSKQNILLENINSSKNESTYVVRRIKFDNFMLNTAKALGVEVIKSRTTYIEFIRDGQVDEVRIFGERGYLVADVVVGAFGLDEAMLGVFEQATQNAHFPSYQRPRKFLRSYITKIFIDNKFIEKNLGNNIYAFIPGEIPNIEFGAVTPKDGYIMLNIAGRNVTSPDMDAFLNHPKVKNLLPDNYGKLDFFEGSFPIAPARHAFGDRYVTVGDSTGWMRPFKGKGINTAFITGMRAAYTMVHSGVSRSSFSEYGKKCKDLTDDYLFGAFVRYFTHLSSKIGLLDTIIKVAKDDKILYNALYNSVSGQDSYKNILKDMVNFKIINKIGKNLFLKNNRG